jgi:quercetin dioxygenase-like cupin family protein
MAHQVAGMSRYLEKEFNSGELTFLLNRGVKAGDRTELHFHDFPHTLIALTPVEVEVWTENGELIKAQTDLGGRVYTVQAGRKHRITFLTDDGAFFCTFARWGKSGYRSDPKRWTGNPEPVVT